MPRSISTSVCFSTQNLLECLSELWTEDGVNDRIERGIEVSQPEEKLKDIVVNAAVADRHDEGDDEEWQPAKDESSSDNGQCLCRLLFPLGLQRNMLLLFLPLGAVVVVGKGRHLVRLGAAVRQWSRVARTMSVRQRSSLHLL